MKYYANFRVNNGTRLMSPITSRNKNELRSDIRDSALAETFQGNTGSFYVWHEEANCPICDYYGEIYCDGSIRYIKEMIGQRL